MLLLGGVVTTDDDAVAAARTDETPKGARDAAIAQLRAGELLSGIGRTIETVAARRGFRIIRNLQSHGVGRARQAAVQPVEPLRLAVQAAAQGAGAALRSDAALMDRLLALSQTAALNSSYVAVARV